MSWSYKITILYCGFVVLILSMVFISGKNKEELVSKDYYAQELKYQERIDAINNNNALTESISHSVSNEGISLNVPSALLTRDLTGEVFFYCPANSAKDIRIKLQPDAAGKQMIPASQLHAGVYQMKIEWQANGKSYYKESVVNIK